MDAAARPFSLPFFFSVPFVLKWLICGGRPAPPLPRRPISLQCGWAPPAVALPPWPAGWRPVADRRLVGCVIWWKFVWVFPGLPGAVRSRDSYATATVPATLLRLARVSRCLPESVKAGPLRLSIFFFFLARNFFFLFLKNFHCSNRSGLIFLSPFLPSFSPGV